MNFFRICKRCVAGRLSEAIGFRSSAWRDKKKKKKSTRSIMQRQPVQNVISTLSAALLSHNHRLRPLVTFSVNSVHSHKIHMCVCISKWASPARRRLPGLPAWPACLPAFLPSAGARQSLSIYLMTKSLLMHASEAERRERRSQGAT